MKKRILIVDDDQAVRQSLRKILTDANFEVALAANGEDAVEQFAPGAFDLLILDLNMPFKDGWETLENLTRADPGVPVIIVTGLTHQYPFAVAAGVGALFEKPVEVPALLDAVNKLLAEPRTRHLQRLVGRTTDIRYRKSAAALFQEKLQRRAETPYRPRALARH